MSPVPGFVACCLFLMLTSSTSALEKVSKLEVMRIQRHDDVVLQCGLDVCGDFAQGTVLALNMFKWVTDDGQLKLLATLNPKNKTDGPVIYDLKVIDSINKSLNITASDGKSVGIKMATSDVQTGDAYLCIADYWHFGYKQSKCLTMLKIRDAAAESTTGATWSEKTTPAQPATGATWSEKPTPAQPATGCTCDCHENHTKNSTAAEQECLQLDVMSLLSFVVSVPLIIIMMTLVILTYRKFRTSDLTQQTAKKVPEADALEIMVRNEPIYSVVKKW